MVLATTDYVNSEQIADLRSIDDKMVCYCCDEAKPGDKLYLCITNDLKIHIKDEQVELYTINLSTLNFLTYCKALVYFKREAEAMGYRKSQYVTGEIASLKKEIKKLNEQKY